MTIPSRPAPAPPVARGLNAAAGANASLEQLRLQLQQQQQTQQQNSGVQKLTIKLPPPPSGRNGSGGGFSFNNNIQQKNNNNNNNYNENSSSITRKFPQANIRYAPATSWDDTPFEPAMPNNTNGNFKKVPPPRPPPPKVQVNGRKATIAPTPPQSVNILNNIFSRKKVIKAPSLNSHKQNNSGRLTPAGVYGTSSGNYNVSHSTNTTTSTSQTNNCTYNSSNNFNMWPSSSAGFLSTSNSHFTSTTTTTSTTTQNQDSPQLISFDSPPSSPTFTQKSNSDCVSVDSFSSDSNFSSPQNGSVSQPESGFEDDFTARSRSTTSPLDPWETLDAFNNDSSMYGGSTTSTIGTAPVRNLSSINTRIQSTNDNPLCNGKSLLPPAPLLNMPTIIKPKISQKPKAPKPPLLFKNIDPMLGPNPTTPPSPPMPKCAPPPAPNGVTLLDVVSGKADALELGAGASYDINRSEPAYGIALYDFDGLEDGDLSFRENEKIYLLEQVSEEWYRGRLRSGCEGIFPINYVDIKIPLQPTTATQQATTATTSYNSSHISMQQTTQSTQHHTMSSYGIPKVKCLYNFPAEVDGDLSLKENDLVTILYKINEDWLYGEVDGRQGQFPSNFLEYVPNNISMP